VIFDQLSQDLRQIRSVTGQLEIKVAGSKRRAIGFPTMKSMWLKVCWLWELRIMYREWASLHHVNGENPSESAFASDRLAEDLDHRGLALQAAVCRAHATQGRQVRDHYRLMEAKYWRASKCPWLPIPDDPELPHLTDPLIVDR
jgi:hypothetical protein